MDSWVPQSCTLTLTCIRSIFSSNWINRLFLVWRLFLNLFLDEWEKEFKSLILFVLIKCFAQSKNRKFIIKSSVSPRVFFNPSQYFTKCLWARRNVFFYLTANQAFKSYQIGTTIHARLVRDVKPNVNFEM